jgi:hypothetical protein
MHPSKWALSRNFLTEDQCDEIIELADKIQKRHRGGLANKNSNVHKASRLCDVVWFTEENADRAGIRDEVGQIYQIVDRQFNGVKEIMKLDHWIIDDRENFQYTEYNGLGEWYDWHIDSHREPYPELDEDGQPHRWAGKVRKMSMSIFLNDPSEWTGGYFEIENTYDRPPSEMYMRINRYGPGIADCKKGNAIIFSSDCYHRVSKLESGNRKSLVCWFVGPPFV